MFVIAVSQAAEVIAFICVIHFVDVITKRFNPASFLTASNCTQLKSGL